MVKTTVEVPVGRRRFKQCPECEIQLPSVACVEMKIEENNQMQKKKTIKKPSLWKVFVDLQIRKQYADAFDELEDEEEETGDLSDHEKLWDNDEDEESADSVPFSTSPSVHSQGSVASEGEGWTRRLVLSVLVLIKGTATHLWHIHFPHPLQSTKMVKR